MFLHFTYLKKKLQHAELTDTGSFKLPNIYRAENWRKILAPNYPLGYDNYSEFK